MAERAWTGGWDHAFDAAYATLLAAVRDGSAEHDRAHGVAELAARYDLSMPEVRGAVRRLTELGLTAQLGDDTVSFVDLPATMWAESAWHLVGLVEVAMRTAAPRLGDDDVDGYAQLVAAARRAASERDPNFDSLLIETVRFWISATPNDLAARLATRGLERLRYGLNPSPPWRVWPADGWLAASLQSARARDAASAQRAAHVLMRLWHDYMVEAAAFLGVPSEHMTAPGTVGTDTLAWVTPATGEAWPVVLGAIRDGSLVRGREYTFRELLQRFRSTPTQLRAALVRLDLVTLVETGPDVESGIRIAEPGVDQWADMVEVLTGMQETCARWAVPLLDDDGRSELATLVATVRRQAMLRDYAYTATMLEFSRFFARRAPNRYMRESALVAVTGLAYVLEDPPPFPQWTIDDYLGLLEEAAAAGDPGLAAEAGHALAAHMDEHIAAVRERYGKMTG